jgi:hypothetical protein
VSVIPIVVAWCLSFCSTTNWDGGKHDVFRHAIRLYAGIRLIAFLSTSAGTEAAVITYIANGGAVPDGDFGRATFDIVIPVSPSSRRRATA